MKVILLSVAVAACLAAAQVARADVSFVDPSGDSGAAPDIVRTTADNDTAGNLTFTVSTNQAALNGDALLILALDTDKNPSTGDAGVEYIYAIAAEGSQFFRWDGTKLVEASSPTATATYASNTATFKLAKADIGGVSSFNFYIDSVQLDADGKVLASDTAPDGTAVYTYTLATAPPPPPPPPPPPALKLKAGAVTFAPAKAVAGRAFAVRVRVTRSDTGAALASGTVKCKVTVAFKPVRAVGTIRAGVATCSLRVPATAHLKWLRGTVTVTSGAAKVSKAFSRRVS